MQQRVFLLLKSGFVETRPVPAKRLRWHFIPDSFVKSG
jgi:hypothetical protein